MTAYKGLKTAAKALDDMSRETEPDLDKMLVEVQRAKQHYDECNQVIETIKAQIEGIFDGSVGFSKDAVEPAEERIVVRRSADVTLQGRRQQPIDDDDMPFDDDDPRF
jgi:hypothetical protein